MVQYSNHGKSLELTISWVEEYILGSCAHENVYLIVAGAIKSDTKYNLQVPRLGLMNQFATKVKVICIENIMELNSVLTECCKIQDMATENDVSRISTVIVLLGLFGHFDRTRSVGYSKDEVGEKEEDEEEDVLSDEKKFFFLTNDQCNIKTVQDICYMLYLVESRKGFKVFVNDYCNDEPDTEGKRVPNTWKISIPIDEEWGLPQYETESCKMVTMSTILERWITI